MATTTQTATPKRPFAVPHMTVGKKTVDLPALAALARKAPEVFIRKAQELIDSGEFTWSSVPDLKVFCREFMDIPVTTYLPVLGQQRAITASAFPLLAGGLTIAAINAAAQSVPTIGQELVTELNDPQKFTVIAEITNLDTNVDRVDEGHDFPEIGAGEEKYEIRSKRNGRRLSITAEVIEENQVADILNKCNVLSEIATDTIEEQTLRRVCDIDGSATSPAEPYVMHRNGAAASLYSTSANTPSTRTPNGTRINSNPLSDTTNLDAARAILANMRNSMGKRIAIPMSQCIWLGPDALAGTAAKLFNSELEPGIENELNNWGPRGQYRPRLLTSPKLDDLSTTAWYLGRFKPQFTRKWKLNFEYVTLGMTTESFLRSRLAFQARIAWDCEIGAVTHWNVVQSLSGTSAP